MPIKAPDKITFATVAIFLSMLLAAPTQVVGQGFNDPFAEEPEAEVEEESAPFLSGVTIGFGINTYQGDLSRNPNNNVLKYVSAANPSVMVGVDRRFGEFEQFGVNAQLQYNRIAGRTTGRNAPIEFTNNLLALDITGDYDLPYIRQGLFRVFLGGGPLFVIEPTYTGFPENDPRDRFDPLGSRVVGSFVGGVSFFDTFRIGVRVPTSGYLDGHTGIDGIVRPDIIGFFDITYRFDLTR